MSRRGAIRSSDRRSLFVKAAAIMLALCLIAALALPAFASDTGSAASGSDSYSYTIRIFPGDKGTIDGSTDPLIIGNIQPGTRWNTNDFNYEKQAKVKDQYKGKYYISGFRESGKDNNTRAGGTKGKQSKYSGSFVVDRDVDFVLSYGMKGSEVAYTIHYVDAETNKELHASDTYHGNVNERPVVSYRYLPGYTPQYYNLTGTLNADASKNNWTFYYNKNEEPTTEEEPTTNTGGGTTTTTTTTRTTTTGGGTTTTG
ncbi:MAG: hypothetical protein Q4F43_05445, partial [Eubacteriales bacterium]|nr:hypothetical protein [Eubacteriales bacterium]